MIGNLIIKINIGSGVFNGSNYALEKLISMIASEAQKRIEAGDLGWILQAQDGTVVGEVRIERYINYV